METTYIRTSVHHYYEPNKCKIEEVKKLLQEARKACQTFIDYLWNNEIKFVKHIKINGVKVEQEVVFNINKDLLECPLFISTKDFEVEGLSQRLLKCIATQSCGMVKASTEKRRKCLYIYEKLKSENKDLTKIEKTLQKFKLVKPSVPQIEQFSLEINSICADLQEIENSKISAFIQLKSLGTNFNKFRLPIRYHKQSNKWKQKGVRLNSFLISHDRVSLRYKIEQKKRTEGRILGADQGKTTCLTFSDHQQTPKNKHGHDLNSVLIRCSRCQKGSKGFKRAQEHRKNYIHWSIKQLNLNGVKQINFEEVMNIRYGKTNSRLMTHWAYTLIENKVLELAEETGVSVLMQSSTYRSQRCSNCGLVRKANRKGKVYKCKHCNFEEDADYNASCNHEIQLPDIPYALRCLNLNKGKGFFWKETGFFDFTSGEEIIVPHANKS